MRRRHRAVGDAAGHLVESGDRLPRATGMVQVLSGEQSNSSVIVDDGESAAIAEVLPGALRGQTLRWKSAQP